MTVVKQRLFFQIKGVFTHQQSRVSLCIFLNPQVNLSTAPPEPVIPSKKPIKVELVGGNRYSWCTCGYSRKQVRKSFFFLRPTSQKKIKHLIYLRFSVWKPFCDGTHKTRAQGMKGLRFVPEKDSTVWLCGCKHTNNPPYCDGTHKQDFIVSAPLHEYTDWWRWRTPRTEMSLNWVSGRNISEKTASGQLFLF